MKVLKFGGTSVGTVDSLRSVKRIVESNATPIIVVVSALGGLTDRLIATARKAASGDESYREDMAAMSQRQYDIINELIPAARLA
ncbi:MAG: bifunctional aspartate kinase/homoserine dehydrogenase I, partial [Muribaculaceae bacterium]|nr:bifunctional aspartate kinase/homoserine dehydrogenase I [Muribaculaceae bacterium]